MKIKTWLAVAFCIILSVCACFAGCGLFGGGNKPPADPDGPAIELPDEEDGEDDKDEDGEQTETHTHTLTYISKLKPTCTDDGTVARWECSDCGKNFTDKSAKKEIPDIKIKATGHTLTHHPEKEATCTENGNVEYWSCSGCGKNFSDGKGNTSISQTVIGATDHTYSPEWSGDETYHWHAATCGHTDVIEKEEHKYNSDGICVCGKTNMDENQTCGKFTYKDFLKTDGTQVKTNGGESVFLRGVNAGGLFVTEHWMTGFERGKTYSDDYKSLTLKFIERFGEQQTQQLWAEYRANWWTDADFKNCADMGMTVIRLPFTYMNVDFAAITDYGMAGRSYDFSALDEFIKKAASYGLYTILDLHGAYGSQNGQDHSGEIIENKSDVNFYSNERMQELTLKLWRAVANRYRYNPAVAGYDILNEPGEKGGSTSETHWKFYDKVYRTIRAENDNHIVMFESCWEWYNLPVTAQYGWTNCIYSFHHYVGDNLSVDGHVNNWTEKLSGIANRNFGLPLQMGEFTAYDSTEKWERTLGLLNAQKWHYTSWTYKVWGNMSWGIVNLSGNKVDPAADSYADIIAKFKRLRTENGSKYTFKDSGRTLESIMRQYLTDNAYNPPEVAAAAAEFENGNLVVTGTVKNVETLYIYLINTNVAESSDNYVKAIISDNGAFRAVLSLDNLLSYSKTGIPFNLRYKADDLSADTTNIPYGNLVVAQAYGYRSNIFTLTENNGCAAVKYSATAPSVIATQVGFDNGYVTVKAMAVGAESVKVIVQNTAATSLFLYEAGEIALGDGGYFELRIPLAEFDGAKSNANLNFRAYINGSASTSNITKGDGCDISATCTYNGRNYKFVMNGTCVSFKY